MKGGLKMEKQVKISIILSVTAVIITLIVIGAFNSTQPGQVISTNGVYTLNVQPENVAIYFSIETKSASLEEARDGTAAKTDALKSALEKAGIDKKDIQTQNYNVYPNREWVNNRYVDKGYVASHSIKVSFPIDSNNMGKVVDEGIDSGATVSYIDFELSQESENKYKAEAIKLASQDAKNNAEAMASGMGQKVGKVLSVSDSTMEYYPMRAYDQLYAENDIKSAVTEITPSEQTITARVSVRFSIR